MTQLFPRSGLTLYDFPSAYPLRGIKANVLSFFHITLCSTSNGNRIHLYFTAEYLLKSGSKIRFFEATRFFKPEFTVVNEDLKN